MLQLSKAEKCHRGIWLDCCLLNTEVLLPAREWLEMLPPLRLVFTQKTVKPLSSVPRCLWARFMNPTLWGLPPPPQGSLTPATGTLPPPPALLVSPHHPHPSPVLPSRCSVSIQPCHRTSPSPGCQKRQDHLLQGGLQGRGEVRGHRSRPAGTCKTTKQGLTWQEEGGKPQGSPGGFDVAAVQEPTVASPVER